MFLTLPSYALDGHGRPHVPRTGPKPSTMSSSSRSVATQTSGAPSSHPHEEAKYFLPKEVKLRILQMLVNVGDRLQSNSCEEEARVFQYICSAPAWHKAAINCPQLWGKIIQVDRDPIERFKTYIDLSKHTGLYIVSAPQFDQLSTDQRQAWSHLILNAGSIVDLVVGLDISENPLVTDQRPLDRLFQTPMPRLDSLSLDHRPSSTYPRNAISILSPNRRRPVGDPFHSGSRNADHYYADPWEVSRPPITHLMLRSCSDLIHPASPILRDLTSLHVSVSHRGQGNPTWDVLQWRGVLMASPRLERLVIDDTILVPQVFCHIPHSCLGTPVELPLLEYFECTTHLLQAREMLQLLRPGNSVSFDFRFSFANGPHHEVEIGWMNDPDFARLLFTPVCQIIKASTNASSSPRRLELLRLGLEANKFELSARSGGNTCFKATFEFTGMPFVVKQYMLIQALCSTQSLFASSTHHIPSLDLHVRLPLMANLSSQLSATLCTLPSVRRLRLDAPTFRYIGNSDVLSRVPPASGTGKRDGKQDNFSSLVFPLNGVEELELDWSMVKPERDLFDSVWRYCCDREGVAGNTRPIRRLYIKGSGDNVVDLCVQALMSRSDTECSAYIKICTGGALHTGILVDAGWLVMDVEEHELVFEKGRASLAPGTRRRLRRIKGLQAGEGK